MRSEAREYYNRKVATLPDAIDRSFKRNIPDGISNIKKIHISGVCGKAMAPLAVLLVKKGYIVSGSDEEIYPPMSDLVESLGIKFYKGFEGENLHNCEAVVIGNVCGPNHPEAKYARENNVPTFSLPEAIREGFIKGAKSLVVSGTHGKTTTTGLLAHVFLAAGKDPGYMIGGVMQGEDESACVGSGEYFVIEGDEYDTAYFDKSPKFLHYFPHSVIITSLEFDHVDIYKNMKEYTEAFSFLVREIPEDGNLFIWGDDENLLKLSEGAVSNVVTYGFRKSNQIYADEILVTESGQEFTLWYKGEKIGRFFTTLPGNHNLLNVMAVCGMAITYGISSENLKMGLETFKGMKRRQEIVGEINGITIIDDFAHHPTAVKETILAIKEKYPGRRLVAFFEPRSATSRRKVFEEDYAKSFDLADMVFISTPDLRPVDDPYEFINPVHVVDQIRKRNIKAESVKDADSLLDLAVPLLVNGDVVLIMSNGSFDGIHKKLAEKVSS